MKMNKYAVGLLLLVSVGCSGSAPSGSASSTPQSAPSAPQNTYEESGRYASSDVTVSINDEVYYTEAATGGAGEIDFQAFPMEAQDARNSETQKIILEANLNMATDRFDEVSSQVREIAAGNSGYVQDSNQSTNYDGTRFLNITVRVPSERYEFAIAQFKSLCVLNTAAENQRNATAEYYDLQARLETKQIEEERLLELIARTEKIDDILKLEELLGQVRTQIEVYQAQMTNIDRLSSYSTIAMQISEVADETAVIMPTNLSGRMYESFVKSVNSTIGFVQGVLIVLVGISVPLFVILVAVSIIWGLFKLRRSARKPE